MDQLAIYGYILHASRQRTYVSVPVATVAGYTALIGNIIFVGTLGFGELSYRACSRILFSRTYGRNYPFDPVWQPVHVMLLIILAGFPATITPGSTSLVTTEPAPTMAFSPMVIPANIVAFEPIEAPRLITVGITCQSSSV